MIHEEYFDWMYHLVCSEHMRRGLTFKRLLRYLDSIEFTYTNEMDVNRAVDGTDFRYEFGYENGYSSDYIRDNLDDRPCSVLEMIMALCFRVEDQIMNDPEYGDRTGQWFWGMMVSLGLGSMSDINFESEYVEEVIHKFLNRDYEPNGKGGLFTIENPSCDLRDVEIWTQCMWYLNDIMKEDVYAR